MSNEDRLRWDEKYALREVSEVLQPDQWLVEVASKMKPGKVLELACGLGHNAVWLASQGWDVDAVDISPVCLEKAAELAGRQSQSVNWIAADLDELEPAQECYDLVLVFRFLDRGRLPDLVERALKPDGILLYETFVRGQLDRPDNHLKNPAFVLDTGELPRLFSGLRDDFYSEIELAERTVARFVGRKQAENRPETSRVD